MTLRSELQVPPVDEKLVARLASLAAQIDGARPGEWEESLGEFNRLSPKPLRFEDFQGISGAEEHEDYIRRLLVTQNTPSISEFSREDIVSTFERILNPDCGDRERCFLIKTLGQNLGDPKISDLIYWPGIYFGDGDNTRNMTPTEMADAALARRASCAE